MQAEFLNTIENFLISTGLDASKFGLYSAGDPNFVHNLRKGKSCTLRRAERVMEFIRANQHVNFRKPTPFLAYKTGTARKSTHQAKETANVTSSK